jgi:quinol monooxygenase YgiN/quercetin dioxygenase-like cupin family protein
MLASSAEKNMIVVSGLVPFRAETRERLHQACVEMAAKSALEPGCLTYEFSGVLGTENTLRLFEEWEDDESLTRHFGVEGFASFSAILRECLSAPPQFTRYDVAGARPLFGAPAEPVIAPKATTDPAVLGDVATSLLFENQLVRVWQMHLGPGEESALHRHDHPYLLCVVEGERIDVDAAHRDSYQIPVHPGAVFFVPPGETERAVNRSQQPFHEILIELKSASSEGLVPAYYMRGSYAAS